MCWINNNGFCKGRKAIDSKMTKRHQLIVGSLLSQNVICMEKSLKKVFGRFDILPEAFSFCVLKGWSVVEM